MNVCILGLLLILATFTGSGDCYYKESELWFFYVKQDGTINSAPDGQAAIRVAATPTVTLTGHITAAVVVARILKLVSEKRFECMAGGYGTFGWTIGVFSKDENLAVYEEFAIYDNPACTGRKRCKGKCRRLCTDDGRSYTELIGLTGQLTVAIREDNLLCGPTDPYLGHQNILVHELAHALGTLCLSDTERKQMENLYYEARAINLLPKSSYVMTDHLEYFAEHTSFWFWANHLPDISKLNVCGSDVCSSELAGRDNILALNPKMHAMLTAIFASNTPYENSGIQPCITDLPDMGQ